MAVIYLTVVPRRIYGVNSDFSSTSITTIYTRVKYIKHSLNYKIARLLSRVTVFFIVTTICPIVRIVRCAHILKRHIASQ